MGRRFSPSSSQLGRRWCSITPNASFGHGVCSRAQNREPMRRGSGDSAPDTADAQKSYFSRLCLPSSAVLPSPPSKPERHSHQPPLTPNLSCISIDLIFDHSLTTSEQTPREVEYSSAAVTFQRLCFGLRRSDGVSKNLIRLSQWGRSAAGVQLCLPAFFSFSRALLFLPFFASRGRSYCWVGCVLHFPARGSVMLVGFWIQLGFMGSMGVQGGQRIHNIIKKENLSTRQLMMWLAQVRE
jgi:hypothetical protein